MGQDPTKLWRELAYQHQHNADQWRRIALALAGVLIGVSLCIVIILVRS